MHESCLDKNLCLSLNANWFCVGQQTPRKAVEDLTSESVDGRAPKMGIDFGFEDDNETISYYRPVEWEEWVELPVRPFDLAIATNRFLIRAPTVIVARHYRKVPPRTPHLNSAAIFERDGYRCAYCGNVFQKNDLNLDHVIPESRGGTTTWTNLVCSCKRCNTLKADRMPHEAGMRLLHRPTAPKARPISFDIRSIKHPTWKPFITNG